MISGASFLSNVLHKVKRRTREAETRKELRHALLDLEKMGVDGLVRDGNKIFDDVAILTDDDIYKETHAVEVTYPNDNNSEFMFCISREVAVRERDKLVQEILEDFHAYGTRYSCEEDGNEFVINNEDEGTFLLIHIYPQKMIKK